MKTNLQKGQILESGFKILELVPLEEMNTQGSQVSTETSIGIHAIHEKTQCEVFHILNDDEENMFAFIFATATPDSTGVAHIVEHSVLCGSQNYPLKDVFTVLCQGSLQTYLNAWTFPDKTVYPASSVHPKDYFNLMSVYGDCVFRPLLNEWTFMQEGHRLECKNIKDKLSITGVVYNEMKGAYSDQDEYAQQWSIRSVLGDTVYAFDSGGDPDVIPTLTFQAYKKFHAERYSPANCKIFLTGNIETEKQFQFINKNFLSDNILMMPAGSGADLRSSTVSSKKNEIKLSADWDKPRTFSVVTPGASGKERGEVFVSWALGGDFDITPILMLEEILLGHDGSPLARALTESPLGEDISSVCGSTSELRENTFCAGLRGVNKKNIDRTSVKIESLIMSELNRLVKEGIPKKEIEAAMFSLECSLREIKRSGGPWSLVWLRRSLRGWLHNEKPWTTLLLENSFEQLKKEYANDNKYFEKLIARCLLQNNHRALVVLKPEKKVLQKKEKERQIKLKQIEKSLTKEQKQDLIEKNTALEKMQDADEDEELLKKVPHISKNELKIEIEKVPRNITNIGGIPVVSHNIFTNGITYCNIAFPLDAFDAEEMLLLPFFADCITSLGLPDIHWAEVSGMLAQNTAGFGHSFFAGNSVLGRDTVIQTPSGLLDIAGRNYLMFNIKTLDDKIETSLELVNRIIRTADFTDLKRLYDILTETKNNIDSSLAPNGSHYASSFSARNLSDCSAVSEMWYGITQIIFIHDLFKTDIKELSNKLILIHKKLLSSCGIIINLTAEHDLPLFGLMEKHFSDLGAPLKRTVQNYASGLNNNRTELFVSPSMQVGFAGMSSSASPYCTKENAAERVMCHYLSCGPLWKSIRSKGGAYGANASVSSAENIFTVSTYRDPVPMQSVKLVPQILNEVSKIALDADNLDKTIIGAYARQKQINTPSQKGSTDFLRFLSNIYDEDRLQSLTNLVNVTSDDLCEAAKRFEQNTKDAFCAAIGSKKHLQGAAREDGIKFSKLPF
ncbi:MAG: insulinase family protein [Termitinemataceae bacterium]|nr:MAG: insulinase family protein [Termitinemataceae bacterium]